MSEGTPNPQINVSKIPGGGGFAGFLFAAISMLIFLIGIPRLRIFFPAAILLGCGIALVLRLIRHETPGKPWILSATQTPPGISSGAPIAPIQDDRPEELPPNAQGLSPA